MARRTLPLGVAAVTFIIALSVTIHVLHLKSDVVLMSVGISLVLSLVAAAAAWKMLGGKDVRRHVHRTRAT